MRSGLRVLTGVQRDQLWDFFGRNDAKAETPVLWPSHGAFLRGNSTAVKILSASENVRS